EKEVPAMPATKEFTVLREDRAGTLGRVCQALADCKVNILALQSFPIGGMSVTRFIVDKLAAAKTALDAEWLPWTETEVIQVALPHRPGEIARVASRLGEADININYLYCGYESGTNTPLVFFGVKEVGKAALILDRAAAAAAIP
ncbi:MAG: ACT domain-containing protein, partial [Bradyrhizobium sp.]